MDEFEYLEKSKNEIITIDNLNKKRLKPVFGKQSTFNKIIAIYFLIKTLY